MVKFTRRSTRSTPYQTAFRRFAKWTAEITGSPVAFGISFITILVWALVGPIFDFSTGWQLAVNSGTTIITFLMVFLLQSSQNRESHAIQLKLDELIRATGGANNLLLDVEGLDSEDLAALRKEFIRLVAEAREEARLSAQEVMAS